MQEIYQNFPTKVVFNLVDLPPITVFKKKCCMEVEYVLKNKIPETRQKCQLFQSKKVLYNTEHHEYFSNTNYAFILHDFSCILKKRIFSN